MSWLAHLVAGPLHGTIEVSHGYWPMIAYRVAGDHNIYRLRCWVELDGRVQPGTPLVYAWDRLRETEAVAAINAYLSLHAVPSGSLAGYPLTRLCTTRRPPLLVGQTSIRMPGYR